MVKKKVKLAFKSALVSYLRLLNFVLSEYQ